MESWEGEFFGDAVSTTLIKCGGVAFGEAVVEANGEFETGGRLLRGEGTLVTLGERGPSLAALFFLPREPREPPLPLGGVPSPTGETEAAGERGEDGALALADRGDELPSPMSILDKREGGLSSPGFFEAESGLVGVVGDERSTGLPIEGVRVPPRPRPRPPRPRLPGPPRPPLDDPLDEPPLDEFSVAGEAIR